MVMDWGQWQPAPDMGGPTGKVPASDKTGRSNTGKFGKTGIAPASYFVNLKGSVIRLLFRFYFRRMGARDGCKSRSSAARNAANQEATMAQYKHDNYLRCHPNPIFDALFVPGTLAPHAGIYRCECCGREIAWDMKRPLPGQGHHEHISPDYDIYWRLTVRATV